MTLLPSETRASIRTALARAVGALEMSGTVTAYTDTTNITCSEAIYNQDDALNGMQIVFKSGTGAVSGNERIIADFTASSDTISVARAWATNPVAGDTFDIYRTNIADKELLDLAIKEAIERVQDTFMLEWEDVSSLYTHSVIKNGGFEDWPDGTTSAPNGWALTGTGASIARNTTYTQNNQRYSCALTAADSSLCYLEQNNFQFLHPWDDLCGRTLSFQVLAYNKTASRLTITMNDGTTTTTDTHTATGWEWLEAEEEIASGSGQIILRVNISAGGELTVYLAQARLIVNGLRIYEYYLPKRFSRLNKILLEGGDDYQFDQVVPNRYWYADPSREKLVFRSDLYTPPADCGIKLVGQRYQEVPDSDDDEIIIPLSYILAQAKAFILQLRDPANAPQAAADALRLRRQVHRQPRANSKYVR